ncbi:hypothetical protein BG004_003035 [Podila humilis]|nr:hypothetical protein BG004_003035 [Podila humilis]
MTPESDQKKNDTAGTGGSGSSSGSNNISSSGHGTDKNITIATTRTTPLGFNRVELARLMIQSLKSLGYKNAAQTLATEAGCELESEAVTQFRESVLSGDWDTVEKLSEQLDIDPVNGIPTVKFLIREQKFLEMLESRQIKSALVVLRSELTPLNRNMERVHTLTSFMMSSSAADLRQRADWDGAEGMSRRRLLAALQKFISPSVMVPEHRLETLLKQAREQQIKHCFYHDSRNKAPFSLYSDHICDKAGIPSVTRQVLEGHTNEVWYISFSHDGKYLASTSVDYRVIIWNMETFQIVHTLQGHTESVSCCAWSPDDSLLVTAGFDKTVKLWDTQTGTLKKNYLKHPDIVSCLGWLPDGNRFISGSDKYMLLMATSGDVVHSWPMSLRDLAITSDGKTVIAAGNTHIHRISLEDMTELSLYEEMDDITAISLSKDDRYLLVNTTVKVHMWDLREGRIKRRYSGYQQGRFVIRPCFGGSGGGRGVMKSGLKRRQHHHTHTHTHTHTHSHDNHQRHSVRSLEGDQDEEVEHEDDDDDDEDEDYDASVRHEKERFVVSGSEDSKIHLWHRENGNLIQTFEGHSRAVTCVAWHPTNPTLFASASDDHTIRIWGTPEDTDMDVDAQI